MPIKEKDKRILLKRLISFSTLLPYILLMLPSRIHFYFLPKFRIVRRVLLFMLPRNKRARGFLTLAPFKRCSLPWFCAKFKDNRWTQGDPKLDRAAPLFQRKRENTPFSLKIKAQEPLADIGPWKPRSQLIRAHNSPVLYEEKENIEQKKTHTIPNNGLFFWLWFFFL